jgi:hypothetical protein
MFSLKKLNDSAKHRQNHIVLKIYKYVANLVLPDLFFTQ